MPRLTPSSSKAPSQRQLRVAELIRHAIAEALQRGEIMDPVLEGKVITVPEVRMSPDLKVATVYVMPLGGKDGEAVIKALAVNAKFLRGLIARRVTMKYAPNLRFLLDTTFDYATKVDGLLRKPEVSRDLEQKLPGSEEDEA
ncbi:ribosome-binding factor A [Labrys miyagiensis]|uniref:Ribosome-binding factor A n=1 Tax=Labrys miyagiensis TaxID=346912 RepID=A0ABQ6CRY8_9HYPH|nr:30S ribosome-binding factor RbfA [Labrys miyagiensis]GLS22357.1 ribosome-binding factor A [Labrys miyagiensis]